MSKSPNTPRVLVLDGQYCHALAAVRSLGRHGVTVDVASHKPRAQSFASRYCDRTLPCPDPNREANEYTFWLQETFRREHYLTVMCFEEATSDILSVQRDILNQYCTLRLPDRPAYLQASHKDTSAQLARQQGVLIPQTFELDSFEDIKAIADRVTFPVVVKGVASSGSQQVSVANNPAELGHHVRRIAGLRRDASQSLPVVQEYIPGTGYGLTALMDHGRPVATFMHQRIAEHDINHGVQLAHGATGAESVDEPELLQAGVKLLTALNWDGIAMVEFKRHAQTGEFYFIEINPRFVGSLELAIACGVDLPWLLCELTLGNPIPSVASPVVGKRFRWLISKNVADAFERPWGYLWGWLTAWLPNTYTDLSLSDPGPHKSHLRNAAWWIKERLFGERSAKASAANAGGSQSEHSGAEPSNKES